MNKEIEKMYSNCSMNNILLCSQQIGDSIIYNTEKQLNLWLFISKLDFIDYVAMCYRSLDMPPLLLQAICITEFANEKPKIYSSESFNFGIGLAMLVNSLWDDLTDFDKNCITSILSKGL